MGSCFSGGGKTPEDIVWNKIQVSENKKTKSKPPTSTNNTSNSTASSPEERLRCFIDAAAMQRAYLDESKIFEILYDKENKTTKPLVVKLVLIELENWQDSQIIAYMLSHIGQILDFSKYGLVHAAIQIGPIIIHWFNDSLVHFTDVRATKPAKAAATVGTIDLSKTENLGYLRKICDLCVTWNITKTYNNMNCNCHHFTEQILSLLGMTAAFEGQLGEYMKQLRNNNTIGKFFMDPDTNTKQVFNTHKELDTYVQKLISTHPDFETKNPSDWALLKAFDRSYWLGYQAQLEILDEEKRDRAFEPHKCPFKNPFETLSFHPLHKR